MGVPELDSELLNIKELLTDYIVAIVAMVAYYAKKMIMTCSLMIRHLFDTIRPSSGAELFMSRT